MFYTFDLVTISKPQILMSNIEKEIGLRPKSIHVNLDELSVEFDSPLNQSDYEKLSTLCLGDKPDSVPVETTNTVLAINNLFFNKQASVSDSGLDFVAYSTNDRYELHFKKKLSQDEIDKFIASLGKLVEEI